MNFRIMLKNRRRNILKKISKKDNHWRKQAQTHFSFLKIIYIIYRERIQSLKQHIIYNKHFFFVLKNESRKIMILW